MGNAQARLGCQRLSLLVEHHECDETARPVGVNEIADFRVSQQIVADLLDGFELRRPPVTGDEDIRMLAVERVVMTDVPEVAYPSVDPEQIECRRRNEVDRSLIGAEILA